MKPGATHCSISARGQQAAESFSLAVCTGSVYHPVMEALNNSSMNDQSTPNKNVIFVCLHFQ
jgi:hypothetical protein